MPRLILEVNQGAAPSHPWGHNGLELQPVLAVFSAVLTFNALFPEFFLFFFPNPAFVDTSSSRVLESPVGWLGTFKGCRDTADPT